MKYVKLSVPYNHFTGHADDMDRQEHMHDQNVVWPGLHETKVENEEFAIHVQRHIYTGTHISAPVTSLLRKYEELQRRSCINLDSNIPIVNQPM